MENSDPLVRDSEQVEMIGVEELANRLRVPKSWIYERTRRNEIPHHKVGKYIRFTREDIEALLDSFQRGPARNRESE